MRSQAAAAFICAFACLLVAWIFGGEGASRWNEGRKLDAHGLLADGRIVGRFRLGKAETASYTMQVNFVPEGGRTTNAVARVSEDYFERHFSPVRSHVVVRYLPENPQVAVIDGERVFPISAAIGLVFLIGGLCTAGWGWWRLVKAPILDGSEFSIDQ